MRGIPISRLFPAPNRVLCCPCGVAGGSRVKATRQSYAIDFSCRRFSSSFMQTVIDQVKRDLEKNESLKEAINELESEAKISQKFTQLGRFVSKSKEYCSAYAAKVNSIKTNSRAVEFGVSCAKNVAAGLNKVADLLHDEKKVSSGVKEKWKRRVYASRKTQDAGVSKGDEAGVKDDQPVENSLVLIKESAWERFGSKLRDMPILASFFENPLLGQIFGESDLAAAIREMKRLDPAFNLPEVMELVEHVVAPHIVSSYLQGDAQALKIHCGECAFNVLNASIVERDRQKVTLDPSILILKDVELKGGIATQEGGPWFIFNFTTQQINCLRNKNGQVFAGDIDDIREVTYSMAISKHPNLTIEDLQYPYMVHEIAIIGNRPCW